MKRTLVLVASWVVLTAQTPQPSPEVPIIASPSPSVAPAPSLSPPDGTAPSASPAVASPVPSALPVPPECGDFMTPVAAPPDAPPQWLAFMAATATIRDYTMSVHEIEHTDPPDDRTEDRQLKLYFAMPCSGKITVANGHQAGAEAAWHGGHKLRGHLGGIMKHFRAVINDNDPRGSSIRGLPMYAGFFPWIIDRFNEQGPGTMTFAPGPPVNGVPTDVISVVDKNPAQNYGFTKDVLVLDATTHLPLFNDAFHGDDRVLHAEFGNLVINPGLPAKTFAI